MVLYRKKRYKCPQNSIQTNSYFDTKKNHEPIEITRKFKYLNYIYSVSIGGPGDPDPQSGAAAPDPRESPKESRVPFTDRQGPGSIFLPYGQKNLHPWAQRAPLDGPTLGGPLAPPTDQPLPGAGPPSAPVYHPGPGLRPPFGGDHGGGLARPLRSPHPARWAGRLPLPFPSPSSGPAGPATAGTGAQVPGVAPGGPQRALGGTELLLVPGHGAGVQDVKGGPQRGPGWRFPAMPGILPGP